MKIHNRRSAYKIFLSYSLLVATLFVADLPAVGQFTASVAPVPFKNFGKINDHYYRGSQPVADQFKQLQELGIKTIIDLRQDSLDEAAEWARTAGLKYINIALTTKRAATREQTEEFLKLVSDEANWPVFVHCKGGRHRTGQMTAIYRITQDGWTADQAYEEMKKFDFEDSFFYPRTLKKYVYSYYKEFTSRKPSTASTVTTAPSY